MGIDYSPLLTTVEGQGGSGPFPSPQPLAIHLEFSKVGCEKQESFISLDD